MRHHSAHGAASEGTYSTLTIQHEIALKIKFVAKLLSTVSIALSVRPRLLAARRTSRLVVGGTDWVYR